METIKAVETETWEERIARETAERKVKYLKAQSEMRLICKYLGWEVIKEKTENDERYYSPSLKANTPDGMVWFHTGFYGSQYPKTSLSEALPYRQDRSNYGMPERPSISFNLERPAETLAKDIKRRFVPMMQVYAAAVKDRDQADANYKDGTLETFKALFGRVPTEREQEGSEHESRYHVDLTIFGDGYGSADISKNSVTFELRSLTTEQAKKVIKALQA